MGSNMIKSTARLELERGCDFDEQGKFSLAFKHFSKAAVLGNIEAQVNLGNLYDDGKGCKKDPELAVYWYKRAIKRGSPAGAYNLAVHYRTLGNIRWAKYWFKRADLMGDEDAKSELEKLAPTLN